MRGGRPLAQEGFMAGPRARSSPARVRTWGLRCKPVDSTALRSFNSHLGTLSMRPEHIEQIEPEESTADLLLTPQNEREEGSESLETSFRINTSTTEPREKVDSDFFNTFDDDFDESDMTKQSS